MNISDWGCSRQNPSWTLFVQGTRLLLLFPLLLGICSCGSPEIVFNYPEEELDFKLRNLNTPAVYMGSVRDLRPIEQKRGSGHFFTITYPKEGAWAVDPAAVYADALAQDLVQTHLVELVPLRAQADYVLSADLLSLGCKFRRSWNSFLVPSSLGFATGLALGKDTSDRLNVGAVLGAVAMMAVPMSSSNQAEAEVRLTLKDRTGNILWQETCLGEVYDKVYVTATSRQDQELVDDFLPKAVKRCNACLVGQLRQIMIDLGSVTVSDGASE
ncbi:MAG: hypothetical protein KOO60_04330 [Gemmatimonadales bacterium]|nr:hypothetical protein [Gemmatimonadales bacterium]